MKDRLSRGEIRHLHELKAMKEKGVLTTEEFTRHKSAVLEESMKQTARAPSAAPWLLAALAALLIVAVAIVFNSGRSAANGPVPADQAG